MDDPLAAADQLVHAAGRKAPLLISPKLSGHLPPSANPFPTSLQGPPPIDHYLPPGINLIPPHADDQGSIVREPLAALDRLANPANVRGMVNGAVSGHQSPPGTNQEKRTEVIKDLCRTFISIPDIF